MLNPWLLAGVTIIYILALFSVAALADRRPRHPLLLRYSGWLYALGIMVYVTAWTFLGMPAVAANDGWLYLSITMGPILFFLFGIPLLRRMVQHRQRHNLTSLADYIAFLSGHKPSFAALVTLIAVLIAIPYMALQIKAATLGFSFLTGGNTGRVTTELQLVALVMTVLLASLAMLADARLLRPQERHTGLMTAVAIDSVVKLLALLIAGLYAWNVLRQTGAPEIAAAGHLLTADNLAATLIGPVFWTNLLLGICAMFCLPRQFHAVVVECSHVSQLRTARRVAPGYLALLLILVVPIAIAGRQLFNGSETPAILYILALPASTEAPVIAGITFLGIVAAANSMFLITLLALAIMINNHLILPLLIRSGRLQASRMPFNAIVSRSRGASMLGVAAAAYGFYYLATYDMPLSTFGYLSAALALHLAPTLIMVTYARRPPRVPLQAGMLAGVLAWLALLLIPAVIQSAGGPGAPVLPGDNTLVSVTGPETSWRTMLSLMVHLLALWITAALTRREAQPSDEPATDAISGRTGLVTVRALYELAAKICGQRQAREAFGGRLGDIRTISDEVLATPELIRFSEQLLAASIGQLSARRLLAEHLRRQTASRDDRGSTGAFDTQLEQTYEALHFNRRMLETIISHIGEGVSILDSEQCIIGWNRRYLELMDFPAGMPYPGQPIIELMRFHAERGYFYGADTQAEIDQVHRHFSEGRPYHVVRDWQDTGRVIEVRGEPLPNRGYILTYHDITDLKRSEQELRQFTDNSPVAICYTDRDQVVRFANRVFVERLGQTWHEVIGRPIRDILPAASWQRYNTWRRRALAGERVQFELSEDTADGSRYYSHEFIPFRSASGQQDGFYSIAIDITRFRQTEQELLKKEKEIRQYTDHSPVMLFYIDRELRIRYANVAVAEMFQRDRDEIIGKPVREVLPTQLYEKHIILRAKALQGERQQFESSFTDELRQTRYLEIGYYPDIIEASGEVAGFYAVVQDITDRKLAALAVEQANKSLERRVQERTDELKNLNIKLFRATHEARRANANKTRFLAAASHDLLQPLNAARLFVSVIEEDREALPETQRELLEKIDHSLQSAEQLLDKLLQISRLEAGYLTPEPEAVNLFELLHPLIDTFRPACERKGIELRARCDRGLWTRTDPQLLYRMVQNLIANAVRYTERGGVLVCCRKRQHGTVGRLSVYDTGPGIPGQEQEAIFDEFHRVDKAGGGAEQGLGLGLAIVRRGADLLQHEIGLRSAPGRGSCFWIDVSLWEHDPALDEARQRTSANASQAGFLQGTGVLCIDDDADNLAGMTSLIRRWGAEVFGAASGEQALDLLRQHPGILIVLSDYHLIAADSLEFLQRLQDNAGHPLQITVLTAEQRPDIERLTRELGYALLRKPIRPARLRKWLENALREIP